MISPYRADFLGFPAEQSVFMHHGDVGLARDTGLSLLHVTSAPPPPFGDASSAMILQETEWLTGAITDGARVRLVTDLDHPSLPETDIVFGIQHPPNDMEQADLREYRRRGILFSAIAYEGENRYGGGFLESELPLTEDGAAYLTRIVYAGICCDLSHAGWRTARNILKYTDRNLRNARIVATHSACADVYNHPRNLPDDILRGIRDRGGIVGIPTVTFFLHEERNDLEPFLRHLEHAIDTMGKDHVAIGSDGVYRAVIDHTKTWAMMDKLDPRFRARLPDHPVHLNSSQRFFEIEGVVARKFGIDIATRVLGENLRDFVTSITVL